MKILIVNHKDINYEFRLLEHSKVIQITKDCDNPFEEVTYEMFWNGKTFRCSYPGARYHKKYWHSKMVTILCQQPSIKDEPWAEWAEEIGYERRLRC